MKDGKPDKSIISSSTDATAEFVLYELGRQNWDPPWIPDLRGFPNPIILTPEQAIDIIILGDGYLDRSEFESQLDSWLDQFFKMEVFLRFCGAFRIHALFHASPARVTDKRTSYYRVLAKEDGEGLSSRSNWWKASGARNSEFRSRIIEDMAEFDFSPGRYPADLDVSSGGLVIHNELDRLLSNCVLVMLARTEKKNNASGFTRRVPLNPAGTRGANTWVNTAFGANSLHEFGHAFAYLEDEYINGRGSSAGRSNPSQKSVFTLSNLAFDKSLEQALWRHISPWGRLARQGTIKTAIPIVGWLWLGGEKEKGVWHSEYHCLMNGKHDNYLFIMDATSDPTANPDGTYTDENGARLRSDDRFCLWCQEIVCIRILEKTGQLGSPIDPADPNVRGRLWYDRWIDRWRDRYWDFFEMDSMIDLHERIYADQAGSEFDKLNDAGLQAWQSDLYQAFAGEARGSGPMPADLTDGELILMLES